MKRVVVKGGGKGSREEGAIRKTWPIYYRARLLNGLRVFASDFGKTRFFRVFCYFTILLFQNGFRGFFFFFFFS